MMSSIPVPDEVPTVWRFETKHDGSPLCVGVLVRESGAVKFFEAGSRDELWELIAVDGWPRHNRINGGFPEPAITEQIAARYRPNVEFLQAPDQYRVLPPKVQ